MKILIISANTGEYPDPVFPLGACYIATACENAGYQVATFDCNFKTDAAEALEAELHTFHPDVIGISLRNVDDVSYPNAFSFLPHYRTIVETCRAGSDAVLVLGGSAAALFPEEYLAALRPDHCIAGEGEVAFLSLLQRIENGEPSDAIIYADKIDLDGSSRMILNRKLFDIDRYYQYGGMLNVQTKRGCGFHCSFCTFPFLEGSNVRTFPVTDIVDEVEHIYRAYDVRHLFFVDSVFNYPQDHAMAICEEIIRRQLDLRWTCYMRPSLQHPDLLPLMKRAGCDSIELGTESMSPTTLASLNKSMTAEEILLFCDACHRSDIAFCHSIIFGAPGETRETVEETVRNVTLTAPQAVIATVGIRIYPNTLLADFLLREGFVKDRTAIHLTPSFYIDENISEWISGYLETLATTHKNWIVPGRISRERAFVKKMRKRHRKGSAWEFKLFEKYT